MHVATAHAAAFPADRKMQRVPDDGFQQADIKAVVPAAIDQETDASDLEQRAQRRFALCAQQRREPHGRAHGAACGCTRL